MPKSLFKIVGFTLIVFTISETSQSINKQSNLELAKRSLFEREKEFFKSRPISEDLHEFIERYKRKNSKKREKRSQNDMEENLYILQDGQLMPFKNIKSYQRYDDYNKRSDANGYTVVPLVIPLVSNQQQQTKLLKIRNLNEELQNQGGNAEVPPPPPPAAVPGAPSIAAPLPLAPPSNSSLENSTKGEQSDETNLEDTNNNNNTKEETAVLHKILQDVEGLMQWKHEGNKKEGVICNLNGSWISDAAGMRFDICYKNSTRKKFRIHVADRIPPNEDGFLCDGNWTVFGELPFIHSGMVIALAVHSKDKHIATFIGECRVCEGSETVTGTWLVARSSRDCKDQKAAHKILSDVWRREQGHTLRKKHLQQLGYNNVKEED